MANINKLRPEDLNCNIFSCYDYDGLSIQELLCQFFHKINETVEVADRTVDLAEWLVNQGLVEEVAKTLNKWRDDGTLKKIINTEIFNDLSTRVTFNSKLYPQGNTITDPIITDYSEVLTPNTDFTTFPYGYGSLMFHVKNNSIHFTGAFNINSTLYDKSDKNDYYITNVFAALKQERVHPFNLVGYSTGYDKTSNFLATLENNGKLYLDKTVYKALTKDTRQDTCLSLSVSFPQLKNYPLNDSTRQAMDVAVSAVQAAQNESTSTIVLASDTHTNVEYNINNTTFGDFDIWFPTALNYVNSKVGAFSTIVNGDVLTEKTSVNTTEMFEWLMKETRRQYCENTIFVLGNHDDQSLNPDVVAGRVPPISKNKFNQWMNKGKTGINFAGNNEPFFYADDTTGKCRHIILNSHDVEGRKIHSYKYGSAQAKWLVNVLNETPDEYAIVLYAHISPKESKDMTKEGGNHMINGDAIHQMFKDYKNRNKGSWRFDDGVEVSWDFTKALGLIAGCISGHEHEDYTKTTDGINYIVEESAQYDNQAYSFVVVDGRHRRIKVFRYNFNDKPRTNVDLEY